MITLGFCNQAKLFACVTTIYGHNVACSSIEVCMLNDSLIPVSFMCS